MTDSQTIPDAILAAAAELTNATIRNYERNQPAYIARDAIAKAIHDAVMAERERCEPAVKFSKEILKGVFEGCDIDGFGAQKLGVECGVLDEVAFDPSKHSDPDGFCEPGDWWFEYSGPLATPKAEEA